MSKRGHSSQALSSFSRKARSTSMKLFQKSTSKRQGLLCSVKTTGVSKEDNCSLLSLMTKTMSRLVAKERPSSVLFKRCRRMSDFVACSTR